jgi:hypothetical protein
MWICRGRKSILYCFTPLHRSSDKTDASALTSPGSAHLLIFLFLNLLHAPLQWTSSQWYDNWQSCLYQNTQNVANAGFKDKGNGGKPSDLKRRDHQAHMNGYLVRHMSNEWLYTSPKEEIFTVLCGNEKTQMKLQGCGKL